MGQYTKKYLHNLIWFGITVVHRKADLGREDLLRHILDTTKGRNKFATNCNFTESRKK